ncbi:Tn3 family transposase, partial [Francisella sp. XLW-1]|uniref:Tn3 family transposase n=1 Tax=Francisella sp. XLW-1 TaxID=2610887 RepID=UPI00123D1461
GLKHVRAGSPHISYKQLEHIKDYFISKDNIKDAIGIVANALLNQRWKALWGEMPIAVAGDSTQFTAYFQNLISEYHNRYGGRGVMIYWHVEKNACCINSQLKSVSNSEVSAMIEGVLKHCTEMSVEKSYVDTHGQSEVGFAFSHLLGFNLMPRLANLSKQKLSRCEIADYNKYSNIQDIMTDTINWDLIKEQYSEMVKYTIAMKENYADPEAILRRFNRNNLKHPTYLALSQLGKVIKTIFICKYLIDEKIRQEIHEGLNVVELWNGVSKFIFYGRSGEISSNRQKNQEISVLSLHLLQLSMVYINTLMIQQIIKENNLMDKLTKEDKRAITPLIYEHVNPYGLFPLDMNECLPDLDYQEAA